MKTVKSLILGSAAGLVAMSGAQAADLPVKAKAVEYVRICSLYGAGFFYIPGTDTCIKIGGYLRADLTVNGGNGGQPFWSGSGAYKERYTNWYNDYGRFAITMDTRTATEYGVVRTFGQADFTFGTEGVGNGINLQAAVNTAALNGGAVNNFAGNGGLGVEFAFVQFAGFTFGKSASAYATPWQGYPGNLTSNLVGGYDTVTGINNIQYTAQFGNGVSASIGVDDSSANGYNRTQIVNAAGTKVAGGNFGLYGSPSSNITALGNSYGGTDVPDIVGNIRVDQAWGLFQVSGALHYLNAGYWNNSNTVGNSQFPGYGNNNQGDAALGHPDDKFGGAVMAALQIKNIPTGPGDDVKIEGSYAWGASKYTIGTSGALGGSFYMAHTDSAFGPGTLALGAISDAVYGGLGNAATGATQLQLTNSWGVRGAFNHNWNPYWSTSLFGGIVGLNYNDTAKAAWCNTYRLSATGSSISGITNCDPGFTLSEIGVTTRWTPVKNLTFSSELLYAYLHTKMQGSVNGALTSAFPTSGNTWNFKDQGTLSLELRAQRNF